MGWDKVGRIGWKSCEVEVVWRLKSVGGRYTFETEIGSGRDGDWVKVGVD